ncbi:hypothetical protein M8J76_005935 [Diaphorina citri]|nr:hypothetical protein M8J76_005935 [Diaphorina citri]
MNFSNAVKKSVPSYPMPPMPSLTNRVSYVPRNGYGKTTSQSNSPKVDSLYLSKKCGFSLPFDSSIPMDKYLCAVGDIVGDEKMVFAGKNNNIVKFYLINEAEVNKLYDNHPQLVIEGKILLVRKLVDNGHKIFLCNTEPGMSDALLINEISKYAKVVSDMRFVNLGSRNERFSHLIGFRRAVFVDNIDNLPGSFPLFYENMNYKIFIIIDRVKCFKCNSEGHLRNNCPVESVSVQERLVNNDETTVTPQAPQVSIRNDAIISTFLPSFGSPTATTAVSPLTDVSCSSPQPQTADGASTSMAEAIVHPPPISLLEDNPDTAGPATLTTISPGLDLPNSNLTVDSSSNQITLPENKLKNLAKTISSATTVTNPAPDPTPSSQS